MKSLFFSLTTCHFYYKIMAASVGRSGSKKRKIYDNSSFKSSWTQDFLSWNIFALLCLICKETIAVNKEYNIKRRYKTKHASEFEGIVGQLHKDRINHFKQGIVGQQTVFKIARNNSEAETKIRFLVAEANS